VMLFGEKRALIRLTADSDALMTDTLLEEYSHVLRHECPLPIEDEHDAMFWAILAAVTKKWRGE